MEILTAWRGKQCMHCWSQQCVLYAELSAKMHFVGEDYRRACCLLKTTCWLQHIIQKDVSMLVYGTDARFRGVPQDSPLMWSTGRRMGNLCSNQGFRDTEMEFWLSCEGLLQSPYYFCHLSPRWLQPLNIHDVKWSSSSSPGLLGWLLSGCSHRKKRTQ